MMVYSLTTGTLGSYNISRIKYIYNIKQREQFIENPFFLFKLFWEQLLGLNSCSQNGVVKQPRIENELYIVDGIADRGREKITR